MSAPIQIDELRPDQVAPRLRQVQARELPEHNKAGQRTFFSEAYDVWILLKGGRNGTFVLEYYKGCPCGS